MIKLIGAGSHHEKKLRSKYQKQLKNLYLTFCPTPKVFYLGFLSLDIHELHDSRERGRTVLASLYYIHPFQEHIKIRRTIATENSFLNIVTGLEQRTFGFRAVDLSQSTIVYINNKNCWIVIKWFNSPFSKNTFRILLVKILL